MENQWKSSSLITQQCKYLMLLLIEKNSFFFKWYIRFNHYRASFLVTGGLGVPLRTARWFHVLPAPPAGGFTWSATTCDYLHEPVITCWYILRKVITRDNPSYGEHTASPNHDPLIILFASFCTVLCPWGTYGPANGSPSLVQVLSTRHQQKKGMQALVDKGWERPARSTGQLPTDAG